MSKPYLIGIDFGTLSGRCILVDARDGRELAESVYAYPHGVMDECLPCGTPLPPQFALQHPQDYLDVLSVTIPDVLQKAGAAPGEVAGLGFDFTACTWMPVDAQGLPLCFDARFAAEPHAYVKLWKHHASQPQADRINALAAERGEDWLPLYGGKISSEWALPKTLEVLEKAPAVFAATARFTEAADWLSRMLTGVETHSASFAGYKALWRAGVGYPSDDFFTALHPGLHGIVGTRLSETVYGMDRTAGVLSSAGAALTGLPAGTPLALPQIDGHAAMPALGIVGEGELMMIMGTSSCHIINSRAEHTVPGICGYVRDGVVPGYATYEAGQAGVGDIFDWCVRYQVPGRDTEEAARRGVSIHQLLRERAMRLEPGQSGLLALDWLNGNRNPLMNADLSGLLLGLTLNTRPEEIYRAWIEATAYGTRLILENFERHGVRIGSITVGGGIAQKDEMAMQIYADVTGRDLHIAGTVQAAALGSAMYAGVAAGIFPDLSAAAGRLTRPSPRTYRPVPAHHAVYTRLYQEYRRLHDYFGCGENPVMLTLRELSRQG